MRDLGVWELCAMLDLLTAMHRSVRMAAGVPRIAVVVIEPEFCPWCGDFQDSDCDLCHA